ncbi:MAG TPA: hypothetical protein ENJ88_07890 [Phaeodactylibacter sp.]|nr:hypothetical protein [Phaeodactylibacter sp.]
MPVITLTTDLSTQDHYLALLKGRLLAIAPDWPVIDVRHAHSNFRLTPGAYALAQTWRAFPEGSLHLCALSCFYKKPSFLFAVHEGHYFVAPDNGLLSLFLAFSPDRYGHTGLERYQLSDLEQLYRLETPADMTFSVMEVFAGVVQYLKAGKPVEEIGIPARDAVEYVPLAPVIGKDYVRGTVIYTDHFGNAILNVSKKLFQRVGKGRRFALFFKNNSPLTQLSRHYGEVPVGEPLCLFNTAGLLEIAVHMGNASELFSLRTDDTVQIEFQP